VEGAGEDPWNAKLIVRVFLSAEGLEYDTEPALQFEHSCRSSAPSRRTVRVDPAACFAKVVIENLGPCPASRVRASATLGCL